MGRRDAELLTDFFRLDAEVLAHEEHLRGAGRQAGEAVFQHLVGEALNVHQPAQEAELFPFRRELGELLQAFFSSEV